jgi:hypothetical protein
MTKKTDQIQTGDILGINREDGSHFGSHNGKPFRVVRIDKDASDYWKFWLEGFDGEQLTVHGTFFQEWAVCEPISEATALTLYERLDQWVEAFSHLPLKGKVDFPGMVASLKRDFANQNATPPPSEHPAVAAADLVPRATIVTANGERFLIHKIDHQEPWVYLEAEDPYDQNAVEVKYLLILAQGFTVEPPPSAAHGAANENLEGRS